jgi:hypothetical protein
MAGTGADRPAAQPVAVARAEQLLGVEAKSWARPVRRGWSMGEHWTVVFADGTRAFLKTGSIDPIPQWIRDEYRIYQLVRGPFMPALLGFDDGDQPLLVLEDLVPAYWPPPWRDGDVELVLETLEQVARVRVDLPPIEHEQAWDRIERVPDEFLSTGLRDAAWLEAWLPRLKAAAAATPLAGDAVVHCDVRSDNLCIRHGRCVLVDWNHARRGNAKYDVAFWGPSLMLERGPAPWTLGVDEFAAFVAGFFAARAGLPKPPGAPMVRDFQREQAAVALDWVELAAAQ